jgi:hypothetical protein
VATVSGGCRFRASNTVTSSSSPCNHTFGHSAAHALEHAGEGCVLSRMYPDGGIPVSTLWERHEKPLSATSVSHGNPAKLGARSAGAPPSAEAGWPRLPRPAKTERGITTATPGNRAHQHGLKVVEARGKEDRGDWARQVRVENPREGSGPTAGARDWRGVQRRVAACVRRATCAKRHAAPPRVPAFGTAACWTMALQRSCLEGPFVRTRRRLSGCKRVSPVRPLRQTGP